MTDPVTPATSRPGQYRPERPELKPMAPVDLEKWLTPEKWLALTQPSTDDSAKLDTLLTEQKKMRRQLQLVTDLLVSALEDREL